MTKKAVVYFAEADLDAAKACLIDLKTKGMKANLVGVYDFQASRDVEIVDEVYLVSDAPHIAKAYEDRGIKVNVASEKPEPKPRVKRNDRATLSPLSPAAPEADAD